jgi:uncharacterized protein (UPF0332 family)
VKPEAADYLDKARSCLADAQQIATLPLPHIAAREAYLAVYNAAEAYVFEFTGRPAKTHRGLRATFSRLVKDEPRVDQSYITFLAKAYEYKSIADYSTGTASRAISVEDATLAIATAGHFIDMIALLLSPGG